MICDKCRRMVGRNKLTNGICKDKVGCKEMQDKKIELDTYQNRIQNHFQNVRLRRPK